MARRSPRLQLDRGAAFDSLFQVARGERVAPGLKLIDRERIVVREQARRDFDPAPLAELSRSIQELQGRGAGIEGTGILLPLLVIPEGSGYYLVAGERRFRASAPTEAKGEEGEDEDGGHTVGWEGVAQLPCLVLEAGQDEIGLLQLVENMQRQDLGPIEEARAFQVLMDERSLSQRDLARLLGKSRGYITNRLSLLSYSPDVQDMVVLRKTTIMHAPLLQAVEDPELRRDLIHRVVTEDISIATLQAHIEQAQQPQAHEDGLLTPYEDDLAPSGLAQDHLDSLQPQARDNRQKREAAAHPTDPLEQIATATASIEEALRQLPLWKSGQPGSRARRQMRQAIERLKSLCDQLEAEPADS